MILHVGVPFRLQTKSQFEDEEEDEGCIRLAASKVIKGMFIAYL